MHIDDLNQEHPFAAFMAGESYESPSERQWLRWVKRVERLIGCDLDGNQASDGFSLDFAYDAWAAGDTAEAYAEEVRIEIAMRSC